jgi:hypothetical protein
MAIVVASGKYYEKTSMPLTSVHIWTWMSWGYATTLSAYEGIFGVGTPDTYFYSLIYRGTNDRFLLWNGSAELLGTFPIATNTWYWTGVVASGSGAGQIKLYVNGSDTADISHAGNASITVKDLRIGCNQGGDQFIGRVGPSYFYNAALTSQEIAQQMWQTVPARTADLIFWQPWLQVETTDYSGAGNTLTQTGTPTLDHGPPIVWKRGRRSIYIPSAAQGNTYNEASVFSGSSSFADSSLATFNSATTIPGTSSYSDSSLASFYSSLALPGTAGYTDSASAIFNSALSVSGASAFSDVGSPIFQVATALSGNSAFSSLVNAIFSSSTTLASTASYSDIANAVFAVANTLTSNATYTNLSSAIFQSANILTGNLTFVSSFGNIIESLIQFSGSSAFSTSSLASFISQVILQAQVTHTGVASAIFQSLNVLSAAISYSTTLGGTIDAIAAYSASSAISASSLASLLSQLSIAGQASHSTSTSLSAIPNTVLSANASIAISPIVAYAVFLILSSDSAFSATGAKLGEMIGNPLIMTYL